MNILNAWSILSEKNKKYWLTISLCQPVCLIRCVTCRIDRLFRLSLKFGKKTPTKHKQNMLEMRNI